MADRSRWTRTREEKASMESQVHLQHVQADASFAVEEAGPSFRKHDACYIQEERNLFFVEQTCVARLPCTTNQSTPLALDHRIPYFGFVHLFRFQSQPPTAVDEGLDKELLKFHSLPFLPPTTSLSTGTK